MNFESGQFRGDMALREKKADYDFLKPVENYQFWQRDETRHRKLLETAPGRKEGFKKRLSENVFPVLEEHPQVSNEGKVRYAVCGSYVYLLMAMSEEMSILGLDKAGRIVGKQKVDVRPDSQKAVLCRPGDVDVAQFVDESLAMKDSRLNPDSFLASPPARLVEYQIEGRKVIGVHPLDQFIDSYVALTGASGGRGALRVSADTKRKFQDYEFILVALLQSYNIDEIAEMIITHYKKELEKSGAYAMPLDKPGTLRESWELKGTDKSFQMDVENFGALLELARRVAERFQKRQAELNPHIK